jgi:hypothetical protein
MFLKHPRLADGSVVDGIGGVICPGPEGKILESFLEHLQTKDLERSRVCCCREFIPQVTGH